MARLPVRWVLTMAAALGACSIESSRTGEARLVERARVSMGSEVRLSAWTDDEDAAVAAFEAAFDEFDRLDRLMSVWIENSDVQRINAAAGREPVPVSDEVLDVLRLAQQVAQWTGGKFDVTFGALSGLWKFDHDQDNRVPAPGDIASRVSRVNYADLVIDDPAGTVFLRRAGMQVHLGGIGKGYAVDRAASILRSRSVRDFLVQSGGDLYASGSRGDRPWRTGVRDPRADRILAALDLKNEAISTSGDYERYFMEGGTRYHHILDPDSGRPAQGTRSVSVMARTSALADVLATGVFVLGAEAGLPLIEKLDDVEAVIVTDTNEVKASTGLKARLRILAPPTAAP